MAISPLPLEQGKTTLVQVQSPADLTLSGSLLGYPLHFFPGANGGFVSLQGIPRLDKPGMAEFVLSATTPAGRSYSVRQNLLVEWKDYGFDSPLQVADNVVDPAITEPEFNQLMALTSEAPAEKMWYSAFQPPTPYPDQLTSLYGRLRSYNGSPFEYYHSGMDYAGNETTPVLAPAAGIVVFTGELTVRGNATLISHGWGVYTGYWHQSRIDVSVGDRVEIGQQIGMVGMTGRVTGPHLHFDVIVGGVEVDPEDWLTSIYAGL
jgi:murein DD-endopeptidase MepM/ murein hydrolase activator NlpD